MTRDDQPQYRAVEWRSPITGTVVTMQEVSEDGGKTWYGPNPEMYPGYEPQQDNARWWEQAERFTR